METEYESSFMYGSIPSVEKVTTLNENDLIDNVDNDAQLTNLIPVTVHRGITSPDTKKNIDAQEKLSDGQSVSDFSQDDSLKDPDFIPVDEKDSESARNTLNITDINKLQEVIHNEEEHPLVDGERIKSRKRLRNEEKWKRNIKKKRINSGQEYVSRLGKLHKAKTVLPACSENCTFECSKHVNDADRLELFKRYYKLADKVLQREFLAQNIRKN